MILHLKVLVWLQLASRSFQNKKSDINMQLDMKLDM